MRSPHELQALAKILGGVPILGVLPGSAADRAGLRYGDVLVSVNGVEMLSFEQFLRAHDASRGELELEVFRDGTVHHVLLQLPATARPSTFDVRDEELPPSIHPESWGAFKIQPLPAQKLS
jgi:S1-C subfamily serine protease